MTKPNLDKKQCSARSSQTGKPCSAWAVHGFKVCRMHGAGGATPEVRAARLATLIPGGPPGTPPPPPPPLGHQRARKHGAYTSKLLPEEQEEHARLMKKFSRGLGPLDDFDEELVDVLALCLTKVRSCAAAGAPAEAVMPWAKLVLEHMRELKATRASKDIVGSTGNTPAEVMAALFLKVTGGKQADRAAPVIDVTPTNTKALPASGADSADENPGQEN